MPGSGAPGWSVHAGLEPATLWRSSGTLAAVTEAAWEKLLIPVPSGPSLSWETAPVPRFQDLQVPQMEEIRGGDLR